ncbi:MAG: D-cysteine desulfhydrase family protein [Chthoniobacterales bacterium]
MKEAVKISSRYSLPPKRVDLLHSQTPLTRLSRASEKANADIWIKRDDLLPIGLGGNKLRKLEYLLSQALAENCDCIITAGAMQSNHCRLTAASAAMLGLECHLALGGAAPALSRGNLLLDELFGAHIHWSGNHRKGEMLSQIADTLRQKGKRPYLIPYGGSNAIGALGFVEAAVEIHHQLAAQGITKANIVTASSSGGTQSGMTVGAHLLEADWQIHAIGIDKSEAGDQPYPTRLTDIANEAASKIGSESCYSEKDFIVHTGYLGEGYGVISDMERSAIRFLAQTEGLIVDPVYTGRAFAGCLDLLKKRELEANIPTIFWHTGGVPALFAFEKELSS